jgi:MinD-like ATPase involved in chromosome partitioning or flagellar assembly
MVERYVVLGLAPARRGWFQDAARWATAAMLPVEFVMCLALDELRVRLSSGRPFSAVLVDAGVPGVDRDLADAARRAGCALLVVDDGRAHRDWRAMGAAGVLPSTLDRHDLLAALKEHAAPIARGEAAAVTTEADGDTAGWRGDLVAVTGARGAGASTVAMAVAQGLAADPRHAGLVVLADLALDADQALLHDSGDVVPGLQELVDAHRTGSPSPDDVRALTWDVPGRGYSLLLGLRRHRDWAALRPRAVAAALAGLRRSYRVVVADVDPDVEGEAQCGSADVEERNALARTAVLEAGVVVVVGAPTTKGVHSLVRVIDGLVDVGVSDDRIVTVVNHAPRSPRARAEITRALAELRRDTRLASPVFALERRRLDDALRDGERLPSSFANPLGATVAAVLDRPVAVPPPVEPVAVGSLGAWSEP